MITREKLCVTVLAASFAAGLVGCSSSGSPMIDRMTERDFGGDAAFLAKHKETIVLSDAKGKAKVAVVPAYQGRVMTSTARGDTGTSFGFIKDSLVASSEIKKGINPYGGEDRFWVGPEGGQFSIFFPPNSTTQTIDNWQTPAFIDTLPFTVTTRSPTSVSFNNRFQFSNASGFNFDVDIARTIKLADPGTLLAKAGLKDGDVDAVSYESQNTIKNMGKDWTSQTGLLSIWILGMFKPSPTTAVIIPTKADVAGTKAALNDKYFGEVPANRLKIVPRTGGSAVMFKGDGLQRCKIGLKPGVTVPVIGSYDPARGVLTIVEFTFNHADAPYVNSMWEPKQAAPFSGDTTNSYNDGPSKPGEAPFGPFYELETSSPALALKSGESGSHVSRTTHFQGDKAKLDMICKAVLGVSLADAESAFK